MIGDDVFELDMDRKVVVAPRTKGMKQSACTPLWYVVYKHRPESNAVIHTHSMHAVLATLLDPTESSDCITLTHLEMLKGVGNHAYDDMLHVPIIDNRPTEDQLADQLESALIKYPKSNAVLVRRHGIYVWGDSWEQAKTQAESFDYLLECAVKLRSIGIDPSIVPRVGTYRVVDGDDADDKGTIAAQKKRKLNHGRGDDAAVTGGFHGKGSHGNERDLQSNAIPLLPKDGHRALLLDIEGCTTSISFVKENLFSYAREHLPTYLDRTGTKPGSETYETLARSLREDVQLALSTTMSEGERRSAEKDLDMTDVQKMVHFLMDRDCKTPGLKALQGKMWQTGYEQGELKGHVYGDFKPMLEWMRSHNVPVYIYSSGSVHAQKLLFRHSTCGDLLPWIRGHYDIPTAGNKKSSSSYEKIAHDLKLDPKSIVFCSDSVEELIAARGAGIVQSVMTVRPGNVPIEYDEKKTDPPFVTVHSLLQLCGGIE